MGGASTGVPWPWEPMASTAHGHPFSYSRSDRLSPVPVTHPGHFTRVRGMRVHAKRRTPLTSDGCDGRTMSSTANDRFDLGSLDSSIPRDGGIRGPRYTRGRGKIP